MSRAGTALATSRVDDQRFEQALRAFEPKIRTAARDAEKKLPGLDAADVQQELRVKLWQAVATYDPDNGGSFNTYFWTCANNHLNSMYRAAGAKKRSAVWVQLDPDEFARVVNEILSEFSAEDYAITNLTIWRT